MYGPRFDISNLLLNFVSEATELKGWIEAAIVDVTWLPQLQQNTNIRLAHSSTAIEGNPLSLTQVEAVARGEHLSYQKIPEQEVRNYLKAMKWIWKKKPKSRSLISENELFRLHQILTQDILPKGHSGKYKNRPNKVVNYKGDVVYVPPGPEKAKKLTQELLNWMNQESHVIHPIIASGIAHHRLVSIHPFTDGNGRISRALALWILYVRGFDTQHILALDEYFWNDRPKYYLKIQQARDLDDDLTYWLEYVAEGVVQTLKQTIDRIKSLQLSHASGQKIILTKRQEDILRFLRDKGRVKSRDIEKSLKITRARVNQIIQPLVKAKLVICEGRTRATTYRLP